MDEWLKLYAGQSERKGETRTYLAVRDHRVVGYVSLMAISISPTGQPSSSKRKVPGVLIARLAIETSWQNLGLGKMLLSHALKTSLEISEKVGIKVVAIEPLSDELCTYYQRFGFEALGHTSRLMVLGISKIKKTKLS